VSQEKERDRERERERERYLEFHCGFDSKLSIKTFIPWDIRNYILMR